MRSKKFVLILSSLLLILAMLLNGCAPAAPNTSEADAPAEEEPAATDAVAEEVPTEADDVVTIVHWQHHYEPRAIIVEKLAQEFMESNPNIKIEFESIPYGAYFEKIGPSLEAGSGPDTFQLPQNQLFEFYNREQLLPMPEAIMTVDEVESAFVPWTVDLLKLDGVYYGLPTDVQTQLLFYNNDLFVEAGLDPSKDFETLEELRLAALTLTKRDGDVLTQAGFGITYQPYIMYWCLPLQVYTEGFVDHETLKVTYANEEGYAMWDFMTGLVVKDKVDAPDFLSDQDRFLAGLSAMEYLNYTSAGYLQETAPDFNFSVHMPAQVEGKEKSVSGTAWSYVVSSKSEHPEEAWKWIEFLTSEKSQRMWIAGQGELPSRVSVLEDPSIITNDNIAAAIESMKYARPLDVLGWDDVYYIHQQIWDDIVLNGMDIKEAVDIGATAEEALYQEKFSK
jgi:multiple sugar transport system substrate-binding protein